MGLPTPGSCSVLSTRSLEIDLRTFSSACPELRTLCEYWCVGICSPRLANLFRPLGVPCLDQRGPSRQPSRSASATSPYRTRPALVLPAGAVVHKIWPVLGVYPLSWVSKQPMPNVHGGADVATVERMLAITETSGCSSY